MEGVVIKSDFWRNRRVFVTGHTGFKGSWISLLLHSLGSDVCGYALAPPTNPSLFELARVKDKLQSVLGDVRDLPTMLALVERFKPEVLFHLAAQSLVRESYVDPAGTYSTNVMGTVNVLEVARRIQSVRAVVIVTSDKCYENQEWVWGYRESDPMGGYDPYSSSKGCAELVTGAYRNSFFACGNFPDRRAALASVRAGNVIGGGDWAKDRLIPDIMRAVRRREPAIIRNPTAIRPWQHVMEPLYGYLCLAERLCREGSKFTGGWNFGPDDRDARPVSWIADKLVSAWGEGASWRHEETEQPHEAHYLKLDCSKARSLLTWQPRWGLAKALNTIGLWYKAYAAGADMYETTAQQIREYLDEGQTSGE